MELNLKRRERTQNWNQEEKEKLLELCREHLFVIENKRYDAHHTEAKTRVWFIIHQNFSSLFGKDRSVNRLKEQWRRMKAAARSEIQEYQSRLHSNNAVKNKKPSAFCFKIWDLLAESKRLYENNVPLTKDTAENEPEDVVDESNKRQNLEENAEPQIKYRRKSCDDVLDTIPQRTSLENKLVTDVRSSSSSTTDYEKTYANALQPHNDSAKQIDKFDNQAMLFKEHLMRVKIYQTHQDLLERSNELIVICTNAAKKCFAEFL